jgi:DNA-binding NtrC family response regulator
MWQLGLWQEKETMMNMPGLLIADEDVFTRKRMADLFINAGYQVTVTNTAAGVLYGILKKTAQVVLISTRFDEMLATELIPILKKCNRNLTIILVASELPLTLIRKARSEGIFYHALKPIRPGDEEELREAVKCAFEKVTHVPESEWLQ